MTFLTIIAALYVIVGIACLAYLKWCCVGFRGWYVPVLWLKWDKHGFLYICLGTVYGAADYLIHVGVLAH